MHMEYDVSCIMYTHLRLYGAGVQGTVDRHLAPLIGFLRSQFPDVFTIYIHYTAGFREFLPVRVPVCRRMNSNDDR